MSSGETYARTRLSLGEYVTLKDIFLPRRGVVEGEVTISPATIHICIERCKFMIF